MYNSFFTICVNSFRRNFVEPLSEIIDTRTTSEAPETVETSGEDHIPVIISNRQSESREPSQESVSANEGSNVENNTKEVSGSENAHH
jgi:hypothetical protein